MSRCTIPFALALALLMPAADSAVDPRLVGAWKAVTYHIAGKDYPLEGIFIFTRTHFAANVLFQLSGGATDDANANGGGYRTEGTSITFDQWVQLHVRPGDRKEPVFARRGVAETAAYAIDGRRLVITFPSNNRYVLEKIE